MAARHIVATVGVILALFLLLAVAGGIAAEPKPEESAKPVAPAPTKSATAPPVAIPLADIAKQATEVSNLLGTLTARAAPSGQIENIAKSLPELSEKLAGQFAKTLDTLESEPSLETLQSLQQQWQRDQAATNLLLSTLTQQAIQLQDGLNQLAEWQKTWSSTRAAARASKATGPIVEQIDATLAAIAAAQVKLQSERTTLLDLQSRAAQEVTKCGTALAQIGQFQQKAVAGIFVPDSAPIWSVELWAQSLAAFPDHVRKVAIGHWEDIVSYIRTPLQGSALHAALLIVLSLLFSAARREIAAQEQSGAAASSAIAVFERPHSAALAITLLAVTSPFFQIPRAVHHLLTILWLVPMFRLARPMISASLASAIFAFCLLFSVDTLRQAFQGMQVVGRGMIVAETLGAMMLLFGMRRHYRQIIAERAASSRLIVLKLGRLLLISVLLVALFALVLGYVRLGRLLTPGILVGGILALTAFISLRVVGGAVALTFRVWPLRLLHMVEHHGELVERKAYRVLIWLVVIGWLIRYLNYLGLLDPAWSVGQSLLAAKLERGSIAVSLGDALAFFLTVWLAYLLSRFLRFVLQEDVYPRVHLAPGLSYAASSLLNYIILALGFVAALGVLGVDFSKVSLLAGAFGVGIGFGLQSVVNNFVSGLILLFERPIQVGDAVQVGDLQGRVTRIGMRASILHTFQGAEIIVPNAQLITQEVTNWTRSDQLRRVELPLGVSYGTAPKKVIELLENVARAHPKVLLNPAPMALFMDYGDSAINFELRAWAEFAHWVQVRSDLTVAVYDAVYAAGMTIPFPQRDVHLVRDPEPESKTDPVNSERKI